MDLVAQDEQKSEAEYKYICYKKWDMKEREKLEQNLVDAKEDLRKEAGNHLA